MSERRRRELEPLHEARGLHLPAEKKFHTNSAVTKENVWLWDKIKQPEMPLTIVSGTNFAMLYKRGWMIVSLFESEVLV